MPTQTITEKAKQLLEQDKIDTASRSKRCLLCRLTGEEKQVLEMFLERKRDTDRPTFRNMPGLLRQLGIHTNSTTVHYHFNEHWDGKNKKPKGR